MMKPEQDIFTPFDHNHSGGLQTDKIKILIAELVAGAILVVVLYGLYAEWFSFLDIPEAYGVWTVLFLILLVIIDIFLIVYTLRSWELD
jgi:hypothetical protein